MSHPTLTNYAGQSLIHSPTLVYGATTATYATSQPAKNTQTFHQAYGSMFTNTGKSDYRTNGRKPSKLQRNTMTDRTLAKLVIAGAILGLVDVIILALAVIIK